MILNATLRLGLAGKDKNKTKQTKKKCVDLRDLEISLYGITVISTLVNTPKKAFFDYIKSVLLDISKQVEQRARVGKIFACWHLAIAVTSSTKRWNNNLMYVRALSIPVSLTSASHS